MPDSMRPLKVFLCHTTADKPAVREVYLRLKSEGWIDPWLDIASLLPGQHWTSVIRRALDEADSVIVFVSNSSINREGFVQREMNYVWDLSLQKPRNVIYLIPLRLEDCDVPYELKERQWGDFFGEMKEETYHSLLQSLKLRYEQRLNLEDQERNRKENEKRMREAVEKVARGNAKSESAKSAIKEKENLQSEEKVTLQSSEQVFGEKVKREKTLQNNPIESIQDKLNPRSSSRARTVKGITNLLIILSVILSLGIIAALIGLGLNIFMPLFSSTNASTANITNARMATDESDTQQTTVYSPDTQTFYCFFDLNNAPDDTVVKGVWTLVSAEGYEANSEIDSAEITGSDDTYYFSLDRAAADWPPGKYKIELYIDGRSAQIVSFDVQ